ncbi:MAG: hypothetical protein FJ318_05690 [SAR202 cluster bacterium]|nr:hypothetical protein [SAR202 cluster bacterium]
MADTSLTTLGIAEMAQRIRSREVSAVELARQHLAWIEAAQPKTNAFITVLGEQALAAARDAERDIGAGCYKGPLHGIPYGLKDLYWTKGIRTTSGSAIDLDFVSAEDSAAAARLAAAGAVAQLRRWVDLGMRHVYFFTQRPFHAPVLERFARDVMPHFAS